ncbi:MAG: hypothetical protein GXX78_14715 [Bacteroidales bacterium]|nr:hypothetical protein [Bacteroidales bacterium]
MKGIIYTFDGLGSVNFIRVSGADGKIVNMDDFDLAFFIEVDTPATDPL